MRFWRRRAEQPCAGLPHAIRPSGGGATPEARRRGARRSTSPSSRRPSLTTTLRRRRRGGWRGRGAAPRLPPVRLSTGVRAAVGRTRAKAFSGAHLLSGSHARRASCWCAVPGDAPTARSAWSPTQRRRATSRRQRRRHRAPRLLPGGPRARRRCCTRSAGLRPSNADRDAIQSAVVESTAGASPSPHARASASANGASGSRAATTARRRTATMGRWTGDARGDGELQRAALALRRAPLAAESGRRGSGGEREAAAELPKTAEEWLVAIMAPPTAIRRPSFERKIASRRVGRVRQGQRRGERASGLPPLGLSTAAANARVRRDGHHAHHVALVALPRPRRAGAADDWAPPRRRRRRRRIPTGRRAAVAGPPATAARRQRRRRRRRRRSSTRSPKRCTHASMLGLPPPPPMSPKAYASEHSSLGSASFTPADRLDRARRDGARARRASFAAAQSPDDPVRKAVERHASSSSLRASASEPWLPSGSPARSIPAFSPSLAAEGSHILSAIPSGSPPSAPSPAHAALRPIVAQPAPTQTAVATAQARVRREGGGQEPLVSSDDDDEPAVDVARRTFEDDSRSSMRIRIGIRRGFVD